MNRTIQVLTSIVLFSSVCLSLTARGAADVSRTGVSVTPSKGDNPAVIALIESAMQEMESGRLSQASATLERALHIEPQNAAGWHYLGQVREQQGETEQAKAMAAKAQALSASASTLKEQQAEVASAAKTPDRSIRATSDKSPGKGVKPAEDKEDITQRKAGDRPADRRQAASPRNKPPQNSIAAAANPRLSVPVPDPARVHRPDRISPADTATASPSRSPGRIRSVVSTIPRGQLPLPGECRIWHEDRPVRDQPRPGNCRELRQHIPAGATLIVGAPLQWSRSIFTHTHTFEGERWRDFRDRY